MTNNKSFTDWAYVAVGHEENTMEAKHKAILATAAHLLEWCEEWKLRMEEILSQSAQETLKPEDLIKDLRKYVRGA